MSYRKGNCPKLALTTSRGVRRPTVGYLDEREQRISFCLGETRSIEMVDSHLVRSHSLEHTA